MIVAKHRRNAGMLKNVPDLPHLQVWVGRHHHRTDAGTCKENKQVPNMIFGHHANPIAMFYATRDE
jgi:hypothetical protein